MPPLFSQSAKVISVCRLSPCSKAWRMLVGVLSVWYALSERVLRGSRPSPGGMSTKKRSSWDSSCGFCCSVGATSGVRLCDLSTVVWFQKVSSPYSGRFLDLLVRASGFPSCLLGRYVIFKLNLDKNSAHLAWRQLRSLEVMKYSRFLWSDSTRMGFSTDCSSARHCSKARTMAMSSLS